MPKRQPLEENVFPRLAVRINEGLRKHPDIGRGAGITALISFVDILTALKALEGEVSSRSLVTAALTAFPHRIKARTLESTDQAVKDVLYQTLAEYGMDIDKVALDLLGMVNEKDEAPDKESLQENLALDDEVEKGKASLISLDLQEMLQLFEEQKEGAPTPSILDVLLGLLAGRSGEGSDILPDIR